MAFRHVTALWKSSFLLLLLTSGSAAGLTQRSRKSFAYTSNSFPIHFMNFKINFNFHLSSTLLLVVLDLPSHITLCRPSLTSRLKMSYRSYYHSTPDLWNNLPSHLRQVQASSLTLLLVLSPNLLNFITLLLFVNLPTGSK